MNTTFNVCLKNIFLSNINSILTLPYKVDLRIKKTLKEFKLIRFTR